MEITPKPIDRNRYPKVIKVEITLKDNDDLDELKEELMRCDLSNDGIFDNYGHELVLITEVARSINYQL